MVVLSVNHRFIAWLAACAVLCAALLPVLSHAVVAHQVGDSSWAEVCTVTGMAWVTSADNGVASDTDSPAPGMNMAGCDWCATHSTLAGLSAAAQPLAAPLAFEPPLPAAFLHAPRPLFVWAAAHSRAPPVST